MFQHDLEHLLVCSWYQMLHDLNKQTIDRHRDKHDRSCSPLSFEHRRGMMQQEFQEMMI